MKRIGCKGFCWLLTLLSLACLFGCAGEGSPTPEATQAAETWDTQEFDRSMELLNAYQNSVVYEQGGNAIMSAIDFGLDVDETEDAEGNHRVIIKFDGKLLPYAIKGKYPW